MSIDIGTVLTDDQGNKYMLVSKSCCTHFPLWHYEIKKLPEVDLVPLHAEEEAAK